ncbi:hypothetical protein OS493_022226 [Desmophyllum pertusum]|uniref:Centromere protein C n=1 Tax=Desmophyllum pertusum TaxID=174260 RepID=A0A9W9YB52_9CNID|nr:hypothetical protein OS493_022226 [Desmophyllum pertusum]
MIGNGVKTKRRKRSKIMPPYKYAASQRASKANSSKISITTNSHDSTTESELRADAKKPRLQEEANETDITEKSSKKRTTTIPRKSGRAKRSGRTSEGETVTESLAQGSETESSKDGRDMSGTAMQNSDDDEINDVDSAAVDGVEDSFEATPRGTSTTAQGQPVAALKSILKSGGSVGRTSTVSRKRQITANKSHSGGSDADDESVLPAKQPNRKRLSTVSFASTPLVQESPAVPANLSSTGLSFVSKDSSFRSTDGTFTPGSGGRTVRSSVGSASSSSAGESVIDPEEEVTITNDARQMEDTSDEQNTRRSKRTIIPPLQYWKNERIDYERRKSGGWCIKGVIKNATPTPKKRRKPKQNKKPVERKENNVNAEDSSEEELDNQDLEDFQEITNPTATVLTQRMTNRLIWPLFGGGQVVLRPGAEKGRQFVRNDTMVFYVTKGRVMVTVHQSSAVLHTGSTFFVPQGNSYNIKNLRNTDAKLMFVQIKG